MFKFVEKRFIENLRNFGFVLFVGIFLLTSIFLNAEEFDLNKNLLLTENTIAKEDSLTARNPSFWRKLGFGIGYSGGYGLSNVLSRYYGPFTISRFWLNSASLNLSYKISSQWSVSLGTEYGYNDLKDRGSPRCNAYDSLGRRMYKIRTDWKVYVIPVIVSFKKQLSTKR